MDSKIIIAVSKKIVKDFPEFSGCHPIISSISDDKFSWLYSMVGKTEEGLSIPRTLRLTTDSNGKILKKSTSR